MRNGFCGSLGVTANLDQLCFDPLATDIDGSELRPEAWGGRFARRLLSVLFSEELGAVIQVEMEHHSEVLEFFGQKVCATCALLLAALTIRMKSVFLRNNKPVFAEKRIDLHRAWSETTYHMQKLRDHPECAQQEYDRLLDSSDPGLHVQVGFDVDRRYCGPYIASGILRNRGIA